MVIDEQAINTIKLIPLRCNDHMPSVIKAA